MCFHSLFQNHMSTPLSLRLLLFHRSIPNVTANNGLQVSEAERQKRWWKMETHKPNQLILSLSWNIQCVFFLHIATLPKHNQSNILPSQIPLFHWVNIHNFYIAGDLFLCLPCWTPHTNVNFFIKSLIFSIRSELIASNAILFLQLGSFTMKNYAKWYKSFGVFIFVSTFQKNQWCKSVTLCVIFDFEFS